MASFRMASFRVASFWVASHRRPEPPRLRRLPARQAADRPTRFSSCAYPASIVRSNSETQQKHRGHHWLLAASIADGTDVTESGRMNALSKASTMKPRQNNRQYKDYFSSFFYACAAELWRPDFYPERPHKNKKQRLKPRIRRPLSDDSLEKRRQSHPLIRL
jgi:hypothetical protein